MQSKTVLQPNASGIGDTSSEPEETSPPSLWGSSVYRMLRDGIVNHQSSVPKVNSIYQNPDDQKLYRALRKEGRTAAEARETLNLMGVKPSTGTGSNSSTVPDWFWGNNRKDKKVDFPFYQHKRKY